MSTLNDSVIICDMTPKANKKKTPLGTKKLHRNVRKTFYESPLKHIQLSSKRWKQMRKEQKLMRDSRQIINNKKNFSLMKDVSFQDSIVILSDNENESNNQNDQSNCTRTRKRKKSLEILMEDKESSTFLHDPNKCSCQKDTEKCPKRRRKNSPSLPDNDSSCFLISDTEDSDIISIDVDNENIAPASDSINQNSDDIIVVWSSNTSPTSSKNNSADKRPINEDQNRIFMVDCTPTPENLSYLECDKESTFGECEINTKKDNENSSKECTENVTEENEETSDEEQDPKYLPFSKQGLKLPRAHNISKKLVIRKPQRKNTFLNYRRRATQSSINRIPVIEPSRFESSTLEPAGFESARFEPIVLEPVRLEPATLEPARLQPSRLEPSGPEPFGPKPSGPKLSGPKPSGPEPSISKSSNKLREIIIDGNNVAMAYDNLRYLRITINIRI